MKFRISDEVVVISGGNKGDKGRILKISKDNKRVVVEGVNIAKKNVKGRDGQPGEQVEFNAAIDASNIAIVDPKTGKASRVGYDFDETGKKVRISKSSGTVLTKVSTKKETKNKVKA